MEEAIKEANKSKKENGIPIGCVIVRNGKIIGRGNNRRIQEQDPLLHAEISAIRDTHKKGYMNLHGCELYTTHMPCYLCAGAIIQFGISKVISGESETFPHAMDYLEFAGIEVMDLTLEECKRILRNYISDNADLWSETSVKNSPNIKLDISESFIYALGFFPSRLLYPRLQYINIYQYPSPYKIGKDEKDELPSKLSLDSIPKGRNKYFTIFISIPYCSSMCSSCGFFKNLLPEDKKEEILPTYLEKVILQIKMYGKQKRFTELNCGAVYIGGGTASLLTPQQLKKLIDALQGNFTIPQNAEITLEGNPKDFTRNYFEKIRELPINRISIGLQSTHDSLLRILNSPHNSKEGLECINEAIKLGFNKVNVDLIYGIPTQNFSNYANSVNRILELSPTSITSYRYIIFPNSPMWNKINSNEIERPPSQEELDMWYFWTRDMMRKTGYEEERIGNFCKPSFGQEYSGLTYLENCESIGIGAGAYSFINGYLFKSSNNVNSFKNAIDNGLFAIGDFQSIRCTHEIQMKRYIMHHFYSGRIDINEFKKIFNRSPIEVFSQIFQKLVKCNLIRMDYRSIALTDLGRNYIFNVVHEFWMGK
jgi:oxygen-independent coproporphyrinogen-3 oxidase